MHILLVASAFNSLTQRVHAELRDHGHRVAVELAAPGVPLADAVRRHRPDLIIAPMLTTALPREVWEAHTCLIVHPGPVGDRGPSSLDRAILDRADRWGVTVLQATGEMDAGDVWAFADCPLPEVAKSDLYRGEIADAALRAVLTAVERFASGTYSPRPQTTHRTRPYLGQEDRRIDWEADSTERVLRTLRAADSRPGVLDELLGDAWYLHGGRPEYELRGRPGELLATRDGAVCRATTDGAVWIPELRARRRPGQPAPVKLPATLALADRLPPLPELPAPPACDGSNGPHGAGAPGDIEYREEGRVGVLSFSFPGGAMATAHCRRLLHAYREACSRPTSVLVLGGGRDFFSNGIHLGVIEAADDPAAESWANIQAMDDLVEAVLTTTDRLVVAALGGNAAAGGAMLALAADEVWCRTGVVLNPHYRLMGLYGSEYWTYTLPRRVGAAVAERLTTDALPLSAAAAEGLGLIDRTVPCAPDAFAAETTRLAGLLADSPATASRIAGKKAARDRDEAVRPLAAHREAELALMRATFHDPKAPYHALRRAFVRKEPATGTPPHLADPASSRRGDVTAMAAHDSPPGSGPCYQEG
ncbi:MULTISPECIES: enoyl-CoA hydratase-related protein [unclassified Streptomyces]|uniref:enoyl-CoA hydratase-related protein n=1 Tax=unclassified Streptomyces TaxID=2593676 RepID=UPI00226EDB9F|nr:MULTISPECIES: enoyl-CoA hydratase-related protein [unclassified Streptomyces]MCY0918449.1 enoyl-CoA hydratase-related protein [Streptomyces sp. H27-G5]MCY0955405.1 enoyl-CoA hydratase-related protein [Streptomyces sp. H27-H5]